MNPKLFIDVFYDKEISDWSTFNIIIKPLDKNKEMKFFINLWKELSICANNHFISLEEKYKEYSSIIKELKRNFSVSMDIFKNSIE